MKSFEIILTEEEKLAILRLIDIAVRAQGMNVAEASLVLTGKIKQGKEVENKEVEN